MDWYSRPFWLVHPLGNPGSATDVVSDIHFLSLCLKTFLLNAAFDWSSTENSSFAYLKFIQVELGAKQFTSNNL